MLTNFQFTIGYCYPIGEPENWRARHTFKFWHTAEIKSITRNVHNRYAIVLVATEEPLEDYKVSERCFGSRHSSQETLDKYCTRNGNEYTFPDVQYPEFGGNL